MMKRHSKVELLNFSNEVVKFSRKSGLKYIDEIKTTEYGCALIFPEPIRYIAGLKLNTTETGVIKEIDDQLFTRDNIIENHNRLMDLHRNDFNQEDGVYVDDLISHLCDCIYNIMYSVIFHPNVCGIIPYHEVFDEIKITRFDDDE